MDSRRECQVCGRTQRRWIVEESVRCVVEQSSDRVKSSTLESPIHIWYKKAPGEIQQVSHFVSVRIHCYTLQCTVLTSKLLTFCFKGTVPRDFRRQVFYCTWNSFPQAPDYTIRTVAWGKMIHEKRSKKSRGTVSLSETCTILFPQIISFTV